MTSMNQPTKAELESELNDLEDLVRMPGYKRLLIDLQKQSENEVIRAMNASDSFQQARALGAASGYRAAAALIDAKLKALRHNLNANKGK